MKTFIQSLLESILVLSFSLFFVSESVSQTCWPPPVWNSGVYGTSEIDQFASSCWWSCPVFGEKSYAKSYDLSGFISTPPIKIAAISRGKEACDPFYTVGNFSQSVPVTCSNIIAFPPSSVTGNENFNRLIVTKYDGDFTSLLWTYTYSIPAIEFRGSHPWPLHYIPKNIIALSDNTGIIICGSIQYYNTSLCSGLYFSGLYNEEEAFAARIDQYGNILWFTQLTNHQQTVVGTTATAIAEDPIDNLIAVCGVDQRIRAPLSQFVALLDATTGNVQTYDNIFPNSIGMAAHYGSGTSCSSAKFMDIKFVNKTTPYFICYGSNQKNLSSGYALDEDNVLYTFSATASGSSPAFITNPVDYRMVGNTTYTGLVPGTSTSVSGLLVDESGVSLSVNLLNADDLVTASQFELQAFGSLGFNPDRTIESKYNISNLITNTSSSIYHQILSTANSGFIEQSFPKNVGYPNQLTQYCTDDHITLLNASYDISMVKNYTTLIELDNSSVGNMIREFHSNQPGNRAPDNMVLYNGDNGVMPILHNSLDAAILSSTDGGATNTVYDITVKSGGDDFCYPYLPSPVTTSNNYMMNEQIFNLGTPEVDIVPMPSWAFSANFKTYSSSSDSLPNSSRSLNASQICNRIFRTFYCMATKRLMGVNNVDSVSERVSIYPNPFVENIVLKLSNILLPSEISLTTIEGRTILSEMVSENKIELNGLASLSSGIYLLHIQSEKESRVIKVVKTQ